MFNSLFSTTRPIFPVLGLAFRPFFLLGAFFSAIAIALWAFIFNGIVQLELYGGAVFWHVHEMLFGFVAAIIVGFLLTAVQNWTGVKSVNGMVLGVLVLLWMSARFGFFVLSTSNPILLAAIDIAFLPVAAFFLALPIIEARQWRNLFFVPVLFLFAAANTLMHLGALNQSHEWIVMGSRSGLMLVALLMTVLGGRVIPFFTANATQTTKAQPIPLLEILSLGCVWGLLLLYLSGFSEIMQNRWLGLVFALSASLHFVRWLRWRFWITFKQPMLWTLHLAYLFVVLAFAALGMHFVFGALTASIGWHVLTVGGMGGLILSMMARVSLGHTGRPIVALKWMLVAFVMIVCSALVRTLLVSLWPSQYLLLLSFSAILWVSAYGAFVLVYFSVLTRPRVDNRPG